MQPTSSTVLLITVLFAATFAPSQSSEKPCLGPEEKAFRPGEEKVKPPQLQAEKAEKDSSKLKVRAQLELILDSKGKICQIQIVHIDNRNAEQAVVDFISEHWHFKPATRNGVPVASRFPVNLNLGHN